MIDHLTLLCAGSATPVRFGSLPVIIGEHGSTRTSESRSGTKYAVLAIATR
jgi:hypothetical protein